MHRKTFIKNTALCAMAVSTSGFIHFDGNKYTGDCETTTDILGPFYRPGSPVRNTLAREGDRGSLVELAGKITHPDCRTPFNKAKVELWHCSAEGVYDNGSADYRYRGTTYTDEKGNYSFKTILPVPYDVGNGYTRPAHFHLMITAEGYLPLVTQLYFSGDKNIAKDAYASSPFAKNRILTIRSLKDGSKKVVFDVGISGKLAAEPAAINRLTGTYVDEKDNTKTIELFKKDNLLWRKNEVFGENFHYTGNNTFECPGMPEGLYARLHFQILTEGATRLTFDYAMEDRVKHTGIFVKAQ